MNPPDAEDFVRQALSDADLTITYRRWLPPGKELELYDPCPVCRHDWAQCRRFGICQLMGVGAGINAAIRDSISRLIVPWPISMFPDPVTSSARCSKIEQE